MTEVLPLLIGGLALFLYAISRLSGVMEVLFTDKAKDSIYKYTKNVFASLFIGIVLTMLFGSSSVVIIMTIVFVNAKSLTFKNAMGIVLGANIGTTFSSQLIALDVGKYAIIPMIGGLLFEMLMKDKKKKQIGRVGLYFGMLFFGLFIMEESVDPLKDSPTFGYWITQVENNHIQGALIGGLITLIIQSSSATVGMAIVLGKQGLISIFGGVAIMLGAELGTCSDTLLATINGSRQGIKTGLFHLIYSLLTIIIGLIVFFIFVSFVEWFSGEQNIDNQIANAHMLFNIAGVIIFLPFLGFFEKWLNLMVPEKNVIDSE